MPRLTQYECDVCRETFAFRGDGRPNYGGRVRCPSCKEVFRQSLRQANAQEGRKHYPYNRQCNCTGCFYDRMDRERPGHHF